MLLWWKKVGNELGMVGTKFGCGGACAAPLHGPYRRRDQRSCSLPVGSIGEGKVTTIEAALGGSAGR